ncbi:SpoIIE family protein phosphatase [Methylomarinum vadi]|uniref:SpoIIE family protein phosphatase n=1 Tax=Methylomarinum vadi TaxID=438855 RepID=UPI000689F187|nr:response regulator [Methylomarinum vadi]
MKILIVEEVEKELSELQNLLTQSGCRFLYTSNQKDALDYVNHEDVDLVFIEIVAPIEQRIETVRLIRSEPSEKWVHIIIITEPFAEQSLEAGLEAGADGYITTPINSIILNAKLRNYERLVAMQRALFESHQELKQYREQNEMENNLTKEVFNRLVRYEFTEDKLVRHWLLPSRTFSGDLIVAKRDDSGSLYFFIADATGHGLAAALPTMVVNQVFRALINKGFSVSDVVREINQRLNLEMPVGRFVALAVGKFDISANTVEIWNGGLPDLLLISHGGQIVCRFPSRHVFAGVLSDQQFSDRTDSYQWQEECELIAFSDGVIDAVNEAGQRLGETRFLQWLLQAPAGKRIDTVKEKLLSYIDGEIEQDDISCLSVICAQGSVDADIKQA